MGEGILGKKGGGDGGVGKGVRLRGVIAEGGEE